MATIESKGVPAWFWVASVLALLFELTGCTMYIVDMTRTAEQFAALPQAQQDVWNQAPSWVPAAYAVGVWAGLGGAVGLLLRRKWAQPFFILSLLGVVVQFGTVLAMTNILTSMPLIEATGLPIFIFVATLLLVWFSGLASRRGWLA